MIINPQKFVDNEYINKAIRTLSPDHVVEIAEKY